MSLAVRNPKRPANRAISSARSRLTNGAADPAAHRSTSRHKDNQVCNVVGSSSLSFANFSAYSKSLRPVAGQQALMIFQAQAA